MSVEYVDKKVHTFPVSLSGYTGMRIPESSNVLSEFAFVFQKEWAISKVYQTLWRETFESGPTAWNKLPCCTTNLHEYDCPSKYGCYCIERPINIGILTGLQDRCNWDPAYVGWASTGGIKNWMFFPNIYPDINGNLAGYEIVGSSSPGNISLSGGQDITPHSIRIKTFNSPILPDGYPNSGSYGGAWIYLTNIGVPQKQIVGRYYRLSFWTKAEANSGDVVFDCTDGAGHSNNMRYHFTTTMEWKKHEHIFVLDNIYDRGVIFSKVPNHTFLIDDIILEEVDITLAYPSRHVLWDFGDGTFGTGLSTSHVYSWPGRYDVRTILYDEYGQQLINTDVPSVSVYNVVDEKIGLDFSVPGFTNEIPAGETGFDSSIPEFRIQRYNSWQSYPNLSGSNYTLFLHASGSLSNKLNIGNYYNEKWSHLDQTWSFYKKILSSSGKTDWLPISSIDTTSDKIFYRWESYEYFPELDMNFGVGKVIQCPLTDPGAAFAGTSGIANFKYIDDLPKNNYKDTKDPSSKIEDDPVILITTLDTTNFPSSRVAAIHKPSNINTTGIGVMEGQKLTIPVKVVPTPVKGLSVTATGQSQMPINKIKWEGTPIPFVISTTNDLGYIVETYPALTASFGAEIVFPDVINVTFRDSAGNVLPADFYYDNLTKLPRSIRSRLHGFVIPKISKTDNTHSGAVLSAQMATINPLSGLSGLQVQPDPARGYISQPGGGGNIYKCIALRNKDSVMLGGAVKYPYSSLGLREVYGTTTVIDTYNLTNPETVTWLADSLLNTIVKIDSNGTVLWTASADIATGHNTCSGCTIGLVGLAADKKKDIWTTAHDGGFIAKFDGVSGTLMATISTQQLSSIVAGSNTLSGTVSALKPTAIDTDLNSDIWVSFTHPSSGFIQKFNGVTGDALSGFYGFEQGESPVDLTIDNQNNVYVITNFWEGVTSFPLLTGQDTFVRAWRGVDTTQYPYLTSMGMRAYDGVTRRFAYKMNTFSVSTLSGHGAVYIGGFTGKELPGWYGMLYYSKQCDELFNGWGKIYDIDVDNNIVYLEHHITKQYGDLCPRYYNSTHSTSATNATIRYHQGGRLHKFDGDTGVKYWTVSGLYSPTYVTVDANQNIWVADHTDKAIGIQNSDGVKFADIRLGDRARQLELFGQEWDSLGQIGNYIPKANVIHSPTSQHINGIAFDLTNKLNAINSFENRMYYNQVVGVTTTAMTKTSVVIDGLAVPPYVPYQAYGDFTGFGHYNKYTIRYPEIKPGVGGGTAFNVYPSGGSYNITKFNEDFDASGTIKSYRQQEHLIESESFFDNLYGEIVGNEDSSPTEIGKTIYEKIANFIDNHNDVDTCDVNALYSLCEQYNVPIADYNMAYPPGLRRIVNLGSIKHKKLWGERSKYSENFELDYSKGSDTPLNLGTQIPISVATSTYMLTAGVPVVLRQTFNNEFRLVTPMIIDNSVTFGSSLYDTTDYPLSTYPLSAYSSGWNWNIDPEAVNPSVSGIEISNYYDFYEYAPGFENIQREGVIEWKADKVGALSESLSSLSAWSGDHGILENIIEYQIRQGTHNFIDSATYGELIQNTPLEAEKLVSTTNTYNVTFPASDNAYVINGNKKPVIYLRRGAQVEFVTDITTTNNPLRIFKDPDSGVMTDGVTLTNNAEGVGGKLTYVPPTSAPGMMFYGSLNSRNVGYAIVFV